MCRKCVHCNVTHISISVKLQYSKYIDFLAFSGVSILSLLSIVDRRVCEDNGMTTVKNVRDRGKFPRMPCTIVERTQSHRFLRLTLIQKRPRHQLRTTKTQLKTATTENPPPTNLETIRRMMMTVPAHRLRSPARQ